MSGNGETVPQNGGATLGIGAFRRSAWSTGRRSGSLGTCRLQHAQGPRGAKVMETPVKHQGSNEVERVERWVGSEALEMVVKVTMEGFSSLWRVSERL